jgi:hypothetical protein
VLFRLIKLWVKLTVKLMGMLISALGGVAVGMILTRAGEITAGRLRPAAGENEGQPAAGEDEC